MKCNLSRKDRFIRGAVGVALVLAGTLLLDGAYGVTVVLLGALIVFSASVGFCHVYKVLHLSTLRKEPPAHDSAK